MTQKKPIIGITPSHNTENNDTSLRPTYPKAIAAAGGLPILLPLECSDEDIKQFMDVCDGFLFTGGPDINPFLFGEDTHLKCIEETEAILIMLPFLFSTISLVNTWIGSKVPM